jgi:hypothetical protein
MGPAGDRREPAGRERVHRIEAAKKAAPDGYTLVQMDDAQYGEVNLYKKLPYDIEGFRSGGDALRTTSSSWCRPSRNGRTWLT